MITGANSLSSGGDQMCQYLKRRLAHGEQLHNVGAY